MLRFKNKLCDKGFTLIELLGVIVLLAIIAIIALITVNRNIKNSQETLYKVQINNIKDGAKNWSTDNIKNIPDGETIYLTLAQLKQGGYVEENIKSPSDDKLCFPNDLQISIKSNESGSYEYNVENNDITYVSCENDTLDMTSPYIVLSKGDEVNGDNEVVDYVEIGQNGYDVPIATAFTSSGAVFSDISSSSFKIEKISYKDNSNNTGNLVQSDYQASLQNGILSLKINNITNIGRIYKIVYKLADGDKTVTAVRNVILQDTTPPEIAINTTEDVIIYYKDNNQIKFAPYIFPTTALSITDNGGINNVNYTVEGEKEINDYFNILTDVSNFSSKEFPIIITATDASGNSSKKSQNIKFTLREAKDPVIKLYNSKNELLYENNADDGVIKSYNNEWIDDKKLTIKIESGCPIVKGSSYYIYNANNNETKVYFNSLDIDDQSDISIDIDTIEGIKNLQVYATCGTVDSSLFPNPTVQMESTQIEVDWEAPTCSITVNPSSPDGSNNWYKTKPTVTYQLSDTNGVTGTFDTNGTSTTISSATTNSFQVSDGTYTYTLNGTDSAGKTCTKSLSIKVDTTAPTISGNPSSELLLTEYKLSFVMYNNGNKSSGTCSGCVGSNKGKACSSVSRDSTIRLAKVNIYSGSSLISISDSDYTQSSSRSGGTWQRRTLNFTGTTPTVGYYDDDGGTTLTFTFKTKNTFDKAVIYPNYNGNASCVNYAFEKIKFGLSSNIGCVEAKGGNQACTSTTTKYNCEYIYGCNGYYGDPSVTISASAQKKFTVNFTDSVSQVSGTSSKTCTATSGSTCSISVSDNAGNSKTYTCTYSTNTCS